jgi:hypothetical protein
LGVQVRWDKYGTDPAKDDTFFMENGKKIINVIQYA